MSMRRRRICSKKSGADQPEIMRQEESGSSLPGDPILPPLSLPGTGLTFFPGPLTANLPGTRLPFPSSLRVTNALSLTGLGSSGIPSFVLDLSPDVFMATVLQNIDLTSSTAAGTPPGREGDPAYQELHQPGQSSVVLQPGDGPDRWTRDSQRAQRLPTRPSSL